MDILRRVRPARFEEAEETSTAGHPLLNKQRKGSSKRQWIFISAGLMSLSVLSFVLLKTHLSPSTTQPYPTAVSEEGVPSPEKRSSEPLTGGGELSNEDGPVTSGRAASVEARREEKKQPLHGEALSSPPVSYRQEEKEPSQNKLPLNKKQGSPIKQRPIEETSSNLIGVEPQGGMEMGIPVGTVISQGNVTMEVKDKVWRTLESPYSPILKGKKLRIENGTATLSLSGNILIEASPHSLLWFEQEGQVTLLEGGIHFKIPATGRMNFRVGALSVTKPHLLTARKGLTTVPIREEETAGSLFLHPDGSLRVRPVQGSLSILDQENTLLALTPSHGPITISPEILSGKESWGSQQRAFVPSPEREKEFQASPGKETSEVGELEKYLIEFSIRVKGKDLPADLDAQKFFSLLGAVYPRQDIIEQVKQYPVKVRRKGESYLLILCDKQSEWRLYEDLGETTDRVDHVYDPDERTLRCREALPLYWFLTIPAAAVTAGVVWYEVDKHNDHDRRDTIPLCP